METHKALKDIVSVLVVIVLALAVFLTALPGARASSRVNYNTDQYFLNYNCSTTWACFTNGQAGSYATINNGYGAVLYDSTPNGGWDVSEVYQGSKPWGWGTAPYHMAAVRFSQSVYVDVGLRQKGFNCVQWLSCAEHESVEFWTDFGGQSFCRYGYCSDNGVLEIMLVFGYKGWGGGSSSFVWASGGGHTWWEYLQYAPGAANLPDNQWNYFTGIGLTPVFQNALANSNQALSNGLVHGFDCLVEDYGAYGSNPAQYNICAFYGYV